MCRSLVDAAIQLADAKATYRIATRESLSALMLLESLLFGPCLTISIKSETDKKVRSAPRCQRHRRRCRRCSRLRWSLHLTSTMARRVWNQ
jgi:hypothetical protein